MKNFIRKSFVVALLALPMLSFASNFTNCGMGAVKNLIVKNDGNVIIDMNFTADGPGTGNHEHGIFMGTAVAPEQTAGLRSTLISALHAGTTVRLLGAGGCVNRIVAIELCSSSSTCKENQFLSFEHF